MSNTTDKIKEDLKNAASRAAQDVKNAAKHEASDAEDKVKADAKKLQNSIKGLSVVSKIILVAGAVVLVLVSFGLGSCHGKNQAYKAIAEKSVESPK